MNITSRELAATAYRDKNWTWDEVVNDPVLSRLPFQIELDKFGRIMMSPAANWQHSRIQARLVRWLSNRLGGEAISEVAVRVSDGSTFEPDVVWAPNEFWSSLNGAVADLPRCPPLAIEVLSKSNTRAEMQAKVDAYLDSGATEAWLVNQDGSAEFYAASGKLDRSAIANCTSSEVARALASSDVRV